MRSQMISTSSTLLFAVAAAVAAVPSTQSVGSQPQSDFPFTIAFESGATQFQPGDRITITEVRGTGKDMQAGICRISGTYTLASRDSATLAASVTARDAKDGRCPWNQAQTVRIVKGEGKFTLLLPVSISGWPHVSFYGDASDFGGIYFGAGDGVLRHWCGT